MGLVHVLMFLKLEDTNRVRDGTNIYSQKTPVAQLLLVKGNTCPVHAHPVLNVT